MNRIALACAFLSLTSTSLAAVGVPDPGDPVARYEVRVDVEADLFHVRFHPGPLDATDDRLRFAAFAPGVHSQLDFGRFVHDLRAFDADGAELDVEREDRNTWRLFEPARVASVTCSVEDTFDAQIEEHLVIPCAGTGISPGFAILNPLGVLPYVEATLQRPVELRLEHAPGWITGTALEPADPRVEGHYRAASYRELADRPLLMGELTVVETWVQDIEVDIYVHSPVEGLDAEAVHFGTGEVLEAAGAFLGFAPVERYTFLMMFFDMASMSGSRFDSMGALEHSTSSVYSFPAMGRVVEALPAIVAHEFMHMLTPLHLRSRIIAEFDYSIPTTDGHVWLYEGLTEWTSGILRLRAEVIDLEQYLAEMSGKIRQARRFDPEYSLERISYEWFEPEGKHQYGNIYQLGALTAMLLDVRLLELSGGERGLREVFLELIERYGKDRPFDAGTFLDDFVDATHPEVEAFFRDHVQGNEPLPYDEVMRAVGVRFEPGSGGDGNLVLDEEAGEEALALRAIWMRNR